MYTIYYIYIGGIHILYALRDPRRGHWRLCGPEAWCPRDLQRVLGVLGGPWSGFEGSLGVFGGSLGVLGTPWGFHGGSLEVP